nr:hypothetical protein Hi04_10k_c1889_00021 [uncultured bacterium]
MTAVDALAAETFQIPYGSRGLALRLPRGVRSVTLESRIQSPGEPPEEIVLRALQTPVGSPRLREIARGRRSAAILIRGRRAWPARSSTCQSCWMS